MHSLDFGCFTGDLGGVNAELPIELRGEVASSQIFLRSVDPPSWVTFLADAETWIKALAAWGALTLPRLPRKLVKTRGRTVDISWLRRVVSALG